MAKGKSWIAGAIQKPGALRRSLDVPANKPIPAAKLNKAANSSDATLARRANLAKTLAKLRK